MKSAQRRSRAPTAVRKLARNVGVGVSAPLGATVTAAGVNFSVFSKRAVAIDLLLFDSVDAVSPSRLIQLDPVANRTESYWHAFVPDLIAGQIYSYRAHGPFDPSTGYRFDSSKVLLDPCGRSVVMPAAYDRYAARENRDNPVAALKSVVVDPSRYDWEGDRPLHRPSSQTIVYEMHVRGFTKHRSSGLLTELGARMRG